MRAFIIGLAGRVVLESNSIAVIGLAILLRQYFPRGADLSRFSQACLNTIALRLNQRPRKTLGFVPPADKLRAVLH